MENCIEMKYVYTPNNKPVWTPWMVGSRCCMALISPKLEQLELREYDGTKLDGLGKLLWKVDASGSLS